MLVHTGQTLTVHNALVDRSPLSHLRITTNPQKVSLVLDVNRPAFVVMMFTDLGGRTIAVPVKSVLQPGVRRFEWMPLHKFGSLVYELKINGVIVDKGKVILGP